MLALATEWGVSLAAIQTANDLADETVLRVGQTLSVPPREEWAGTSTYWAVYVVLEGETLGHIAQRFGIALADLMQANELADADLIRAGQELVLPLNTLAAYAEVREPAGAGEAEPELDPAPAPEAHAPSAAQSAPMTASAAEEPKAAATEAAAALAPAAPPADLADWPRETVRIINAIRSERGLPPYIYNDTLAQAAQAHANDCVSRGWCSHTGSDGSSVKQRIIRAGYGGTGWAECWAQQQSPQGAVDIWMDEVPPDDPHRRMMLHTWFIEVGVGVAEAPWGYYFIADFGRP